MKKTLIISSMVALSFTSSAQQIPLQSQYLWNDLLINPAVAGSKDYIPAIVSFRRQWAGIKDAPVTVTGSIHGSLNDKIGIGTAFTNDHAGPISSTSIQFPYSYKLKITEKCRAAFGVAPVIMQYSIDKNKLDTDIPNDAAIERLTAKTLTADLNCGVYFYGENYFAGLSVPQVMESKIRTGDLYSSQELVRHYLVNAGYRYAITDKVVMEPSFLFKQAETLPMELDLNIKALYKNYLWLGLSYRTDQTVAAMLGVSSGGFSFGYSYDYSFSEIRNYNSGSHELFLMFHIKGKKEESAAQM